VAWSTPHTFVVNEVVTAATMNTVRDDLLALDHEVSLTQITAPVTITGTTAAAATTAITAPAFTADGVSTVVVDIFIPSCSTANGIFAGLWLDGVALYAVGRNNLPVRDRFAHVPASGSRVYSVRAWDTGGSGTVQAGPASGSSSLPPASLRILQHA
jgi:hypothetical protein